jgi:hypothetical protein
MNTSRRTFMGGALALACTPLVAAPRHRIAQLEYTSVFFAPHLARMKLLWPGDVCFLEVSERGVMVFASGQLLGLLGQADAAALTPPTDARIHQVWMSAANTTCVSIRLEMRAA